VTKTYDLEISGPAATCGQCRFTSALHGTFSVEDGLLVWRGVPDVQPSRGPDLTSCCESSPVTDFAGVQVEQSADGWRAERLPDEDVAALRESARVAQEEEMRAWHEQGKT
jgi:hypothetical protein